MPTPLFRSRWNTDVFHQGVRVAEKPETTQELQSLLSYIYNPCRKKKKNTINTNWTEVSREFTEHLNAKRVGKVSVSGSERERTLLYLEFNSSYAPSHHASFLLEQRSNLQRRSQLTERANDSFFPLLRSLSLPPSLSDLLPSFPQTISPLSLSPLSLLQNFFCCLLACRSLVKLLF